MVTLVLALVRQCNGMMQRILASRRLQNLNYTCLLKREQTEELAQILENKQWEVVKFQLFLRKLIAKIPSFRGCARLLRFAIVANLCKLTRLGEFCICLLYTSDAADE